MRHLPRIVAFFLLISLLSACDETPPAAQSSSEPAALTYTPLLSRVSQDTVFVYAFNKPLPATVAKRYFEMRRAKLQSRFEGYLAFHAQRQKLRGKDLPDSEADRLIIAVIRRLQADFTRDGLRRLGINLDNDAVLYSQGLAPVFRMTLDNPAVLATTVDEILSDADASLSRTTTPSGWRLALPFGKQLTLWVATQAQELVITLLPDGETALLERLLDPASNPDFQPLDLARLNSIARQQAYDGHALGYIDLQHLLNLLLAPTTEIDQRLQKGFSMLIPEVPEGCQPFLRAAVHKIPLAHAGTRSISEHHTETRFGVVTDDDLSDRLNRMVVSSTLDPDESSLASLWVTVNLPPLLEGVANLLDYLDEHKNKCDWISSQALSDYQAMLSLMQHPLSQNIKGFLFNFKDLQVDPNTGDPTALDLDMTFFLHSSQDILQLLKNMNPRFRSLGLQPNGQPLEIPVPFGPSGGMGAIAASDTRIAIAIGSTEPGHRVTTLLKASQRHTGALMGYTYSGGKLARLFNLPGNPPNVKKFLSLLSNLGNYRGVLRVDGKGISLTHYSRFNTSSTSEE